jgi:hypothetical protein
LGSTAALQFEYPQLIPHLTIKVQTIMHDPSLAGIVDPRSPASISGLHLSSDAQHCAVVLMSGHVLFFKFMKNGLQRTDGLSESLHDMDDAQDIVVVLTDLGQKRKDGFQPICLLDARCGDVTTIALSDEGEISHSHALMYILLLSQELQVYMSSPTRTARSYSSMQTHCGSSQVQKLAKSQNQRSLHTTSLKF